MCQHPRRRRSYASFDTELAEAPFFRALLVLAGPRNLPRVPVLPPPAVQRLAADADGAVVASAMWITTCHRFSNRAEFLAACQVAGWTCPPGQDPEPPPGVALDIVGPIVSPAQIAAGGVPIPGEVLDPRYHVNLAWHGRAPDLAFTASLIVPETPSRGWDVVALPESRPPVPPVIPAWKGKAALGKRGCWERSKPPWPPLEVEFRMPGPVHPNGAATASF